MKKLTLDSLLDNIKDEKNDTQQIEIKTEKTNVKQETVEEIEVQQSENKTERTGNQQTDVEEIDSQQYEFDDQLFFLQKVYKRKQQEFAKVFEQQKEKLEIGSLLPDAFSPNRKRVSSASSWNRVSGIGHPCPFVMIQDRHPDRVALKTDFDDTMYRIFDAGNRIQDLAFGRLLAKGLRISCSEMEVYWPRYKMKGHTDGITTVSDLWRYSDDSGQSLDLPPDAEEEDVVVIDAKGVTTRAFDIKYKTVTSLIEGGETSGYMGCYFPQLSLYGSHKSIKAKYAVLYVINRDNNSVRQLSWEINSPVAKKAIQKAKKACLLINSVLQEIEKGMSWEQAADIAAIPGPYCKGCNYKKVCPAFSLYGRTVLSGPDVLSNLVDKHEKLNATVNETKKPLKEIKEQLKTIWANYHEKFGNCSVLVDGYRVSVKETARGHIRGTIKEVKE